VLKKNKLFFGGRQAPGKQLYINYERIRKMEGMGRDSFESKVKMNLGGLWT
jgi:hypothetical protein